jgi:hypothetical protein
MVLAGSMIHVVWTDYRNGDFDIFYKRSSNKGTHWSTDTRLTTGPAWSDNPFIFTSENTVHLVWDISSRTEKKVFYKRNPKGNLNGLINTSPLIPQSFQLLQNHPNPFNPLTTIQFIIKENAFVEISVYDAIGRKVNTLVSDYLEAGTYDTYFDGSNLSSGIYYYKLIAGDFSDSRKMILVK